MRFETNLLNASLRLQLLSDAVCLSRSRDKFTDDEETAFAKDLVLWLRLQSKRAKEMIACKRADRRRRQKESSRAGGKRQRENTPEAGEAEAAGSAGASASTRPSAPGDYPDGLDSVVANDIRDPPLPSHVTTKQIVKAAQSVNPLQQCSGGDVGDKEESQNLVVLG